MIFASLTSFLVGTALGLFVMSIHQRRRMLRRKGAFNSPKLPVWGKFARDSARRDATGDTVSLGKLPKFTTATSSHGSPPPYAKTTTELTLPRTAILKREGPLEGQTAPAAKDLESQNQSVAMPGNGYGGQGPPPTYR